MMDKLYFIIAMVVAFYISIHSIQKVNFQTESLEGLIKEFNTGYIENMIVLRDASSCPMGYHSLIYNFNWPGNHKGCGCKKENVESDYVFYRNFCPNSKDCKKVNETNEFILNKWKGSLICYKRSKQTYSELKIVPSDKLENCKVETHKICGVIDGKDNILCMEKDKNCPLTEIKFFKKNQLLEYFEKQNITNYENMIININTSSSENAINEINKQFSYIYELMQNTYLYITNVPKENNLVKENLINFFRIDLTAPCLNSIRSPTSEFFFPLMKNRFDLMCDKTVNGTEVTDKNFYSIDTINLENYYDDNKILKIVKQNLDPFDIDISDDFLNIYARPYPGWSIECQNGNSKALVSFMKTAEVMNSMFISVIIHSFISIALIISIGVFSCFISQYFELLFKAVDLTFIIINLIYPIQIISTCNWLINILTDENGSYCGDSTVNIILSEISSACLQLEYAYIMIILLGIFSCIVFIYVLYYWVRPAAKEVNEIWINLRN